MSQTKQVSWSVDGQEFAGHAVWQGDEPRPAVLVCHAWSGQSDFERERAARLSELGYVGIAVDVYGAGKRGANPDECRALMEPLVGDRALLRRRLTAAIQAVRAEPMVDGSRVAVIGFCFGGLCALDVARSGADVRGVVAFHGLFHANPLPPETITASVMALHGYDDPMATPDAMLDLCNELTRAGADWQVHAYGGTMHAFTNPNANDPSFGTVYNARADKRSDASMVSFLAEVLA